MQDIARKQIRKRIPNLVFRYSMSYDYFSSNEIYYTVYIFYFSAAYSIYICVHVKQATKININIKINF